MKLSDAAFADLSALGHEELLPAGAYLWREGDRGEEVILLLDGALEVVHEPVPGEVVVIRSLEPGAIVGELASLDGSARSAAVRAVRACRILRVPGLAFRELVARRQDVLLELFWQQIERVRSLTGRVTTTHRAAITDALTGLYNFGFFSQRLELEVERALATGDPLALAVFDLDHFKSYNDRFGHAAGNDALVKTADAIRSCCRRSDMVARYGGEEFVVLLYGARREEAAAFAEQIRARVEETRFGDGASPVRVTLSGGVATLPDDTATATGLFAAADDNLYRAKAGGRNRIVAEPPAQPDGTAPEAGR